MFLLGCLKKLVFITDIYFLLPRILRLFYCYVLINNFVYNSTNASFVCEIRTKIEGDSHFLRKNFLFCRCDVGTHISKKLKDVIGRNFSFSLLISRNFDRMEQVEIIFKRFYNKTEYVKIWLEQVQFLHRSIRGR